jgi:two-component system sensor histidine kinase RegB
MNSQQALHIERRAEQRNLKLLVWLRWLAISGQMLAVIFTHHVLQVPLPMQQILLLLGFLVVVNLVAAWRAWRPGKLLSNAILGDLLVDVAALTVLLFLTGGATNPFTGLFILQAIVAAILLRPWEAITIFVATVGAQFWLLGNGLPLNMPGSHHMGHGAAGPSHFDLHLQGMFLSFFLSGSLAVMFILGIRSNLARRDRQMTRMTQQMEEETVVLRLGLMAGTAAHDLGTPLTNLAVILDDWVDLGPPPLEELRKQALLMQEAVTTCRESISHMLRSAGQSRLENSRPVDAAAFAGPIAETWSATHPGVTLMLKDQRKSGGAVLADILLERALENLFDNAREAGATALTLVLADTGSALSLCVEDNGPGFPAPVLEGRTNRDTGGQAERLKQGHGLGLLLVQSVVRRLNGELVLSNLPGGGARACITLPTLIHTDAI